MRLSDAIWLGAMLRPQGFKAFWRDGKSCAMGAAMDAIGRIGRGTEATRTWPWLDAAKVQCPKCGAIYNRRWVDGQRLGGYVYVIAHLNDHHRWTRERIADWVATVEPTNIPLDSSVTDATVSVPTEQPQEAAR